MDKNAINKFAIWARRELIERVSQRAAIFGITAEGYEDPEAESINGRLLSSSEKNQRKILINSINDKGFEQVIEEVAYTWFNRFAALRFMEVNGYLPSHVRVFTNDAGEFKPQILTEAIHLELDGLNMDKVYELENANKTEELFKYLLVVQCNALNSILPGMFQRIDDYTELLLPDNLLREGSVIEKLAVQGTSDSIPESDWTEQVQIIGWLYQYYNTEPKDKVFARPKGEKIRKEDIPAATQLFTPDWIVHYMVENSLGRLWLEGHPNDSLKSEWKNYLNEAEQEEQVKVELENIRKEYAKIKPEELKVIDPCSGSGHILCVLFDVLVRIYEDFGYTAREAVTSIVEKNLYGLDIDERAAQLSYFAVMMKARQYDRRFFSKKDEEGNPCIPQPHVYVIEESNAISSESLNELGQNLTRDERDEAIKQVTRFIAEMYDAKEYGSLVSVEMHDWDLLRRFAKLKNDNGQMQLNLHGEVSTSETLQKLISIGETLAQKYEVVVTNPPYIGSPNMGDKLLEYIKKYYPDSKADIYAAFIERNFAFSEGYVAMITQTTWMFQSRFEKIREKLYTRNLVCMNHLGTRAFDEISGEVVQTTAFSYRARYHFNGYRTTFVKLVDYPGEAAKEAEFANSANRSVRDVEKFKAIPGAPFAHYISDNALNDFNIGTPLKDALVPKQGTSTGDDETYVHYWYEVNYQELGMNFPSTEEAHKSLKRYFPLDKGGEYRKWYGNNDRVIRFDTESYNCLLGMGNHLPSRQYYFLEGLTWSKIASELSVRFSPRGFVFSSVGLKGFPVKNAKYILAFMNSSVCRYFVKVISPGMSIVSGDIEKLPFIYIEDKRIDELCDQNIQLSKMDWDAYEISWDFKRHPFVELRSAINKQTTRESCRICDIFQKWKRICEDRFEQLCINEETLNKIFISIYQLGDEVSATVDAKDVSARKADLQRESRSFISYAVGCMFGRYSLDESGLVYAGGNWDSSKYTTFPADEDAILPICDDEYFEDDIVGLFISFIEKVYGKETLEENLQFIAEALGGKGTSREIIRNYFITGFYADHVKVYQKRPIYWLFDSGKKNGFKCLIYLHRYKPDTIARIRTDYIHEQQSRYRTAIEDLNQRINGATASEKVKLGKKLTQVQEQAEELRIYEEKIHHLADQMIEIDLDDGVKVNYAKFQNVLARIK